jgi:hypothetical protein
MTNRIAPQSGGLTVLCLVKGIERYIWLYDDADVDEAVRTLGRMASNKELSFTWYDATVLSRKMRLRAEES